jgi:PPOX class probable F420-dependent enzyme
MRAATGPAIQIIVTTHPTPPQTPPTGESALTALGGEAFVSLTTFRRSGEGVSTTVWVARDGDALVVITPRESGKVKRLRNDPRVEVRPCSRRGQVPDGVEPVAGTGEIVSTAGAGERLRNVVARKYGLQFRIVMAIERLVTRTPKPRVLLRITAPA